MGALAVENKVVQGRKMRGDTTVGESNIHYPADSSWLGDGDRVLTRLMKKVTAIAGGAGAKLRDGMRSVQRHVAEIARASRAKGAKGQQKLEPLYRKLLAITGRVVGQAKRFFRKYSPGLPDESTCDGVWGLLAGAERINAYPEFAQSADVVANQEILLLVGEGWSLAIEVWLSGAEGQLLFPLPPASRIC